MRVMSLRSSSGIWVDVICKSELIAAVSFAALSLIAYLILLMKGDSFSLEGGVPSSFDEDSDWSICYSLAFALAFFLSLIRPISPIFMIVSLILLFLVFLLYFYSMAELSFCTFDLSSLYPANLTLRLEIFSRELSLSFALESLRIDLCLISDRFEPCYFRSDALRFLCLNFSYVSSYFSFAEMFYQGSSLSLNFRTFKPGLLLSWLTISESELRWPVWILVFSS